MLRAFELAVLQLSDPKLRTVIWQSLALSLVLQILLGVAAWYGLLSFANFSWTWVNEAIRWLGAGAVVVLALMLFPAVSLIVMTLFLEKVANIVEERHYPHLGKAPGIPVLVGLWSTILFLLTLVAINLVMLPFYILAIFVAGLGALLFYAINGFLAGREYYEQVALRRVDRGTVKAWRSANTATLWGMGIVIVFLGTIPILNLIVPVLGIAAMVHMAQKLRPPTALTAPPPFNPPARPG
jgi:CysZ protein